jgi:predicted flap endonuclease-1-like 5' DNA nuclease
MVVGMATKKVTVTLDESQLARVRDLVQHAVGVALDDIAGWGALLARALHETGGAVSPEEQAWADEVLGTKKRRRREVA